MKLKILTYFMVSLALTFGGCGGGGGGTTAATGTTTNLAVSTERNITITSGTQIERLGTASISVDVNITNGPMDLYILLTNYATTGISAPAIIHNSKVATLPSQKNIQATPVHSGVHIIHAPQEVEEFRRNAQELMCKKSLSSARQEKTPSVPIVKLSDAVGSAKNFQINETAGVTTAATARKIVSNVTTNFGTRTLNVWVSDDSFGVGCPKTNCLTQAMVDTFAAKFLATGPDNDIYDFVSNIYGSEWGADAQTTFTNLIPYDGNITILLTDINNDNSTTGGVIGYFYSKDNFLASSISGSNERVMFYIDSVLLATPGAGAWNIADFWPQQMISTLAHEFQHMIHFYQKGVKFNATSETWLNEMLSETTEDMVAIKLNSNGPRNVSSLIGTAGNIGNTGGRYPLFNVNNTLSLTSWTGALANYSNVSAFGAFLIRKYGGSGLLNNIVHSNLTSGDAIVSALQAKGILKTFNELLREWGEEVLISDKIAVSSYNTSGFTYNTPNNTTGISYRLGSINFFNYTPSVTINTIAGTVNPQGNYYYKVGTGLNGLVHIEVLLDGTTEATLIAK